MSQGTLLLLTLALGPGPGADAETGPPEGWRPAHPSHADAFGEAEPDVRAAGEDGGRSLTRTVFGFLPYWTGSAYLQYDLISVLALFSVEMDQYGAIWAWHGFPDVFSDEISQIHSAGGLAVITVTNFDPDDIHQILTTHSDQALETMCDLVTSTDVDGVCIDFEQVDGDDRDNLTAFVEDLRADLDAQAPGSHLSVCTPAVDWSGAFDYSALAESCDALFMMCYPFHGSWSTVAGPCCPLVGWGGPESSTNMAWCLGDYVIHAPEAHDRIVVGLPYYGHQWETEDQYTHSAVTGGCSTLIYSTLAGRAETYGRLWDDESQTPWYAYYSGGWNQGWFDDEESLELKYNMVRAADLQGIGIWALGYDGSRPELWECLEESFAGSAWQDSLTDNLESRFALHGPSQYWHQSTSAGQNNGLFYTYSISAGPDVNWAEWRFDLPDSSEQYSLSAYVPDYGAEADAVYRVCHSGGEDTVVVDQAAAAGGWADLGGPYPAGEGLRVVLGDCTGSPGERIVYDAVRFEAVSGIEESGADIGPAQPRAANPSRGGALRLELPASESPRRITVFDASGRVLLRRSRPAGPAGWVTVGEGLPAGVCLVLVESGRAAGTARTVVLP
jgi:spore germination protein YaaH